MRSNAGMSNRQGDVNLRFAQIPPQLELWLGFGLTFTITVDFTVTLMANERNVQS